jgi:hypothetical protein
METSKIRKQTPVSALLDPKIVVPAIAASFVKLDPRTLIKNPVNARARGAERRDEEVRLLYLAEHRYSGDPSAARPRQA